MRDTAKEKTSTGLVVDEKEAEFRKIWDKYSDEILKFFLRREASNRQDAEDLWAETFAECYRNLGKFRGESSVRTWLYGIADRLHANFMRARAKEIKTETVEDYDQIKAANPESSDSFPDPERKCLWNEEGQEIKKALNQLNEDQKMVIILRQIQKLSVRETAEIMKRSEDAIKMLHLRAMKKLTELMQKDPYFSNYMPGRGGNNE